MIKRYIKKIPVVEAVQWTGYNFDEIQDFVGSENAYFIRETSLPEIRITTKYQALYLELGNYIVKNSYGRFYIYTKNCFEKIFEEATE